MIRNIIFDIGKVLIDFHWDEYLATRFDPETAQIVTECMWHNPDWTEFDRGVLSDEEILQRFIRRSPAHEPQIRQIYAELGQIPERKPTSIPLIRRLKTEGFGVYYLSNYFQYLMDAAPEVLDFVPCTDGGIFSCHVQLIKPDHRIFALLCERYALAPAECIFIDDTLSNVEAARRFGMQAIQYLGQTPDELCGEIGAICAQCG